MVHFGLFLGVLLAYCHSALALRCWACSSDLDPSCMDPFNSTKLLQLRNNYNNLNYNNQYNNQYNNNNNNNNNNQNYRNDMVNLRECSNELGQIYGTKQMCVKKIINVPYGKKIVSRECKAVSTTQMEGTCPDRASNIEFCEYCDYDGCNAAPGVKAGVFSAACALLALLVAKS